MTSSINVRFQDPRLRRLVGLLEKSVSKLHLAQFMRSVEGTYHNCFFTDRSYRRGKPESGDVDIIISNSTPQATQNFCIRLVKVLEERGIITHTLTISTATSN